MILVKHEYRGVVTWFIAKDHGDASSQAREIEGIEWDEERKGCTYEWDDWEWEDLTTKKLENVPFKVLVRVLDFVRGNQ